MQKKYKKLGIILFIILVVFLIAKTIANVVIERKVANYLTELPEIIRIDYASVKASVLSGDIILLSPNVLISGETTGEIIANAQLKKLKIEGLGYWNYLINNSITLDRIEADQLLLSYNHNPLIEKNSYSKSILDKINKEIKVDKIKLTNSDIYVTNSKTDSIIFKTDNLNFEMNGWELKASSQENIKPFVYEKFNLKSEKIMYSVNAYDDVFIESLSFDKTKLLLSNIILKTKYAQQELSQILKEERDHFDAKFQSIEFKSPDLSYNSEGKPWFKSSQMILQSPNIKIYRDKLVADDLSPKPLYGKMLRELGFDLSIDAIELKKGKLKYSENANADTKAGVIDFSNLNISITNFGNTYKPQEETKIKVNTLFMESTPLKVDWSFKVQDSTDYFILKSDLGVMDASEINQYTEPNLNVRLNGILNQTYFTISGNPITSNIDLKVKYDNLDIAVLKKDGKERNKFLSGLISLFVSDASDDEPNDYRFGTSENVERDVTKSIFNFVYKNIQSGLISAMAGDGEKED